MSPAYDISSVVGKYQFQGFLITPDVSPVRDSQTWMLLTSPERKPVRTTDWGAAELARAMACSCWTNSQGNEYAFSAMSTRRARASPALLKMTCWTWKLAAARAVGAVPVEPAETLKTDDGGLSSMVTCTCCVRRSVGNGCALPTPEGEAWGSVSTTEAYWAPAWRSAGIAAAPPSVKRSEAVSREGCARTAFWRSCAPVMKYWELPP